MGTERHVDRIADALFPKARQAVLALMMSHPGERFYLREVVQRTGLGQGNVQRELDRLSGAGILRRIEQGRHVYFEADPDCPIYQELRGLVAKTAGVASQIAAALAPLGDRVRVAFIYGSIARQEETPASDVDLMVVGAASFAEVVEVTRSASEVLARSVNPTVYSRSELRAKAGSHFLKRVLAGEKTFVVGDSDELADLLGE